MYRVSPFTYLVDGMLGVGVGLSTVTCSSTELLRFDPPSGQNCGTYMQQWISTAGGQLSNPSATSGCEFCAIAQTDVFLSQFGISYSNRSVRYCRAVADGQMEGLWDHVGLHIRQCWRGDLLLLAGSCCTLFLHGRGRD